MRKGNLIKMAAPAILSAAMMVSGLPVMAADFTSDIAVETEAQTDEFDAADDTADAFAGDEETPFVDDQTAAEDEFAATAETGYKYVYAGLTWAQYWASEGVYNAANTASNATKDSHDELDKGGFDTVTRATVNHGLHRGSYQCEAIMYDKNGGSYEISYWTSANDAVLTDGTTVKLNQPERGQITKADGSVVEFDHYNVVGLKYVPVAVKAEDYEAFKSQFKVVEDGSTVAGGFGENKRPGLAFQGQAFVMAAFRLELVAQREQVLDFVSGKLFDGKKVFHDIVKRMEKGNKNRKAAPYSLFP